MSAAETKNRYNVGNPNTITKNKRSLIEKDIVESNSGKLQFVDPVYRLWFEKEY
jgi:hypothetical protein